MASPILDVASQHLDLPHIPKLQYRTRKSSDSINFTHPDSTSSTSPTSTSSSSAMASTAPTSPGSSDHCLSSGLTKEAPKMLGPVDFTASSDSQSFHPLNVPTKISKRRGKSFFGFFGVKEPSQQAFENYQRQLRKKGGIKNGRVNAVGLPGVSSAKLPPTVPKVNSKWDGVPQGVKDKGKQKQIGPPPSSRGCSRSIGTSGSETSMSTMSSSTRSRLNSRHSSAAGLQQRSATSLSDLYGWETESRSSGSIPGSSIKAHDKARKSSIASTFHKRPILASYPPPLPPSIPEKYLGIVLPKATLQSSQSEGCSSPALGTSETSFNALVPASSSQNLPHLQSNAAEAVSKTTTREIPAADEVIIHSHGFHILGHPASARRKPKTPFLADEAKDVLVLDGKNQFRSDSKAENISHRTGPLAHVDANSRVARREDFTPSANSTSEGHSASALDEGQKPRKKSRLGLFSK